MRDRRSRCRPLAALVALALATVLSAGALGVSAAPVPSPAHPSQPTLSLQQLFKQSAPAVVLIAQFDAAGKRTSLASGFVVSPSGVIVTNHHVISPDQGAVRIVVKLPRGDVYTDVRIVYAEARRDFAVLSLKATGLPTLKTGDSDTVEVGDQVVAIGNPMGLDLTFTSGIVENVRIDPAKGYRFIQHQAPISPGSSGGPLLNMRGEVVGINTFHIQDAQNLNGAVPIKYVKPYFGDSAKMTWEEYAHVSATIPPPQPAPAPATPAPQPAPAPAPPAPPAPAPPSQPAPPAPPQAREPGWRFESAMDYRRADPNFKLGFAAAVSDTAALFAAMAQGSQVNSQVLDLFQCLNSRGDTLGQIARWVGTITVTPGDHAAVSELAMACHVLPSGNPTTFVSYSDYRDADALFKLGFAAGLFDMTSLLAGVAQGAGGIDSQKLIALYRCLETRGDTLGKLMAWMDTATAGASPNNSAILTIVGVCLP